MKSNVIYLRGAVPAVAPSEPGAVERVMRLLRRVLSILQAGRRADTSAILSAQSDRWRASQRKVRRFRLFSLVLRRLRPRRPEHRADASAPVPPWSERPGRGRGPARVLDFEAARLRLRAVPSQS